jgi:hypothetical protein
MALNDLPPQPPMSPLAEQADHFQVNMPAQPPEDAWVQRVRAWRQQPPGRGSSRP